MSGGVTLAGLLYLARDATGSSPSPAVIVCHGLGSRKENHTAFAEFLCLRGLAALVFDFRGHGDSGGSLDGDVVGDIRAAIDLLKARPEIDAQRIAVRGSSMGGHLAIIAGALFEDIGAVVAICPAPEDILHSGLLRAEREVPESERPSGLRVNLPEFLRYLESISIISAVSRISPRALMLVHARGDEVIPYTRTQELYDASGEPKRIVLLEGGSHTSAQHDPSVHDLVCRWLEQQFGIGRSQGGIG